MLAVRCFKDLPEALNRVRKAAVAGDIVSKISTAGPGKKTVVPGRGFLTQIVDNDPEVAALRELRNQLHNFTLAKSLQPRESSFVKWDEHEYDPSQTKSMLQDLCARK